MQEKLKNNSVVPLAKLLKKHGLPRPRSGEGRLLDHANPKNDFIQSYKFLSFNSSSQFLKNSQSFYISKNENGPWNRFQLIEPIRFLGSAKNAAQEFLLSFEDTELKAPFYLGALFNDLKTFYGPELLQIELIGCSVFCDDVEVAKIVGFQEYPRPQGHATTVCLRSIAGGKLLEIPIEEVEFSLAPEKIIAPTWGLWFSLDQESITESKDTDPSAKQNFKMKKNPR